MQNITNAFFWNALKVQYPEAVQLFNKWVDDYKKEIGWDRYIKPGVKFHDLPFELQNGIIARFDIERSFGEKTYKANLPIYAKQFADMMEDMKKVMDGLKAKQN
jgi:hypothetical protein